MTLLSNFMYSWGFKWFKSILHSKFVGPFGCLVSIVDVNPVQKPYLFTIIIGFLGL